MTDSNLFCVAGAGKWLPVNVHTHRRDYLRRDDENEHSRGIKPAVFVASHGDEVLISSRDNDNALADRKFAACDPQAKTPGFEKAGPCVLEVSGQIPAHECEVIQKGSFIALGTNINQKAMRRYGEAAQLSKFHASTFEILI